MKKVIKGLEICYCSPAKCYDCPYHDLPDEQSCNDTLCLDALALLKEQEAVKPLAKEDDSYECICGAIVGWDELDTSGIVQTRLNYCPFCGKPIDWEGR